MQPTPQPPDGPISPLEHMQCDLQPEAVLEIATQNAFVSNHPNLEMYVDTIQGPILVDMMTAIELLHQQGKIKEEVRRAKIEHWQTIIQQPASSSFPDYDPAQHGPAAEPSTVWNLQSMITIAENNYDFHRYQNGPGEVVSVDSILEVITICHKQDLINQDQRNVLLARSIKQIFTIASIHRDFPLRGPLLSTQIVNISKKLIEENLISVEEISKILIDSLGEALASPLITLISTPTTAVRPIPHELLDTGEYPRRKPPPAPADPLTEDASIKAMLEAAMAEPFVPETGREIGAILQTLGNMVGQLRVALEKEGTPFIADKVNDIQLGLGQLETILTTVVRHNQGTKRALLKIIKLLQTDLAQRSQTNQPVVEAIEAIQGQLATILANTSPSAPVTPVHTKNGRFAKGMLLGALGAGLAITATIFAVRSQMPQDTEERAPAAASAPSTPETPPDQPEVTAPADAGFTSQILIFQDAGSRSPAPADAGAPTPRDAAPAPSPDAKVVAPTSAAPKVAPPAKKPPKAATIFMASPKVEVTSTGISIQTITPNSDTETYQAFTIDCPTPCKPPQFEATPKDTDNVGYLRFQIGKNTGLAWIPKVMPAKWQPTTSHFNGKEKANIWDHYNLRFEKSTLHLDPK